MVLESHPDQGEDEDQTPEPANGRYRFFDGIVCNQSGQAEDTVWAMQEEEDKEEEEWLGVGGVASPRAPGRARLVLVSVDDVSFYTQLAAR